MKQPLVIVGLLSLLGSTSIIALTAPAWAGNSNVEATIQSYGDLSMFYQGLINTGVINELKENEHYTIFAPTNAAFTQIRRDTYPCFYAEPCRPQIAAVLRNHIMAGKYDLKELTSYGYGVKTSGGRTVYVQEPFVGDYTVDGQKIISSSEVAGNVIYRIDGVIATPQDLTPFQTVNYVPAAGSVTTEKTVVRKTYRTPSGTYSSYPAGTVTVNPGAVPDDASQTTTVTRTITTDQP